jgi:hypothetical protein
MAFKLSTVARNAACDAVVDLLDTGYIRIYDGSQPANPQAAISGPNLLAELRFGATAFGAASAGVATANAITGDASANATGTATWARILQSDGSTVSHDATVGTSGTDIVLNGTSIVSGGTVDITAMTFTIPE